MESYNSYIYNDKVYQKFDNSIIYLHPVPYEEYLSVVGLIEQLIVDNIPNRIDDIHIQPIIDFYPIDFGLEKAVRVTIIFALKGYVKSPEYRIDKSLAFNYVLESYMIDKSNNNIIAEHIKEHFSRGIVDKLNDVVHYIIQCAKTGKLEINETGDMI
jgi:hypothetical protein